MDKIFTDFVIIGSGAAGSILSYSLSKEGYEIALVDSAEGLPENDNISNYIDNKPKDYNPRYSGMLGGNTEIWGSKIWLMSEEEFKYKDWGFKYNELVKYSSALAKKLKINHNDLLEQKSTKGFLFRKSFRAKFKNIYNYLNLENNHMITLFSGFSPIKLNTKKTFDKLEVKDVIVTNARGKKIQIKFNCSLIFCAGGLNNAKLILSLCKRKSNLVGMYLNDHPHVNIGKLDKKDFLTFNSIIKPYLKQELLDSKEGNYIFKDNDNFSGVQLDGRVDVVRFLKKIYLSTRNKYSKKFIKFVEFLILKHFNLILKILHKMGINKNLFSFEFFFSQSLDKRNKVFLSEKKDIFNLPKLNIEWNISKSDTNSYNRIIENVFSLTKTKLKKLSGSKSFSKSSFLTGYHPSSTTKIGDSIKTGVVDSNLKLYNYKNIYVCGSSVFPSKYVVNPTWTIMCLSKRLSAHLSDKFKK